jgi:hypothetical protein
MRTAAFELIVGVATTAFMSAVWVLPTTVIYGGWGMYLKGYALTPSSLLPLAVLMLVGCSLLGLVARGLAHRRRSALVGGRTDCSGRHGRRHSADEQRFAVWHAAC